MAATWGATVSLSRASLRRTVVQIVEGLAHHGRFVLANYQADPGHLAAIAAAPRGGPD